VLKRKEIEKNEERYLASYAMHSAQTGGRAYKEKEHDYRTVYQRDRDRVIYSTAFRRLEYKTQVFVNHEGDHYRTRLTHTLEVAQIGRTIARALRLNEDLVEAIALAHDLGHTPFGHSGEKALHEIMKDHGGFEHNSQGLRVVDYLEERYPNFQGLNLSFEVREGIIKHATPYDMPRRVIAFEREGSPLLEIQVVDIADEIAYDNHDLDDGLASELVNEKALSRIGLWRDVYKDVQKRWPSARDGVKRRQTIRNLINLQVSDLLKETESRIKKFHIKGSEDVRRMPEKIITFSPGMRERRKALKEFLLKELYNHYRVVRMSNKAYRFVQELFKVYLDKPMQLPPATQFYLKKDDPYRVICDYIAGMTDRYALDEYKKFFAPYEKV